MNEQPRVAIQGEMGSNSAKVAENYFATPIKLVPCLDFDELFVSVEQCTADFVIAPIENSLTGYIYPVWDLIGQQKPLIIADYYLHVKHCLIGQPDATLNEIRTAHSHEQALAQCSTYLQKNNIIPQKAYDTAGAVKIIKERGENNHAAIAPKASAKLFGMKILAEDIQTSSQNYTRFFIISKSHNALCDKPNRQTIIIDLVNRSKMSQKILHNLFDFDICSIQTQKIIGEPWIHRYYIEINKQISNEKQLILQSYCEKLVVLSPYSACENN